MRYKRDLDGHLGNRRIRLVHGFGEAELTLGIQVHKNRIPGYVGSLQYFLRQRVLNQILNSSFQRTGAINRIVASVGDIIQNRIGNLESEFVVEQALIQ